MITSFQDRIWPVAAVVPDWPMVAQFAIGLHRALQTVDHAGDCGGYRIL
jgi:hypothetical protein